MDKGRAMATVSMACGLILLSTLAPTAMATSPVFPTTVLVQSGMKYATIGGYSGVLVNYTSSISTSFVAFVYIDLVNSAGQTVYWNVGYCSFAANQKVQCFVPISSTGPGGDYTASAFATTTSNVPVSSSGSLSITI